MKKAVNEVVINAIASEVQYSAVAVYDVYKAVKSFSETIEILQSATVRNVNPWTIVQELKDLW